MLTTVGRLIYSLYLVRVPLIVLLIMAEFGFLAVYQYKPFLGGVFDQEDGIGLTSVALVAFLTAAAAVTAINLTLYYGTERFDLTFPLDAQTYAIWIFLAGLIPPVILIWCACQLTSGLGLSAKIGAGLGGFLLAAVIVITAKYFQLSLTDPAVTTPPPPYLVFPADRLPLLGPILKRVYCRPTRGLGHRFKEVFSRVTEWIFHVFPALQVGYVVPGRLPFTLQSGHVFAATLALFSVLLYLLIGWGKKNSLGQHRLLHVPSLTYVLLALMVACWLFSALAFFLDRYRFPVLLGFAILTLFTRSAPKADHFYRVEPMKSYQAPAAPSAVLERYTGGRIPVLIATAGGGIQASAWTAMVLASLEKECAKHSGCDFKRSIAALSSVSGGSVGSMHFGATYANPRDTDPPDAVLSSRESSLDDVAWGWINPDVWRAILPWIGDPLVDRGWALERSQEEIATRHNGRLKDVMLSEWKADTKEGRLPAFLFNSTNIETGAPLVFATTRYRPRIDKAFNGTSHAMSFEDRYDRKFDIRIATAVRMSASFPYVSPAARSNGGSPAKGDWHLVDGGYYDNYGLFTLMDWLEDALEEMPKTPPKIVIVRIISFPPDKKAEKADELPVHGWGFQLGAPLSAFLNVRNTAQLEESLSHLRLFEDYWAGDPQPVNIVDIPFQFPDDIEGKPAECAEPPLSWKLTEPQKKCIDDGWANSAVIRGNAQRLMHELGY